MYWSQDSPMGLQMMVELPDAALSGGLVKMDEENQHTADDSQKACDSLNKIRSRQGNACLGLGKQGVNVDTDEGKASPADAQGEQARDDSRDGAIGAQGFQGSVALDSA